MNSGCVACVTKREDLVLHVDPTDIIARALEQTEAAAVDEALKDVEAMQAQLMRDNAAIMAALDSPSSLPSRNQLVCTQEDVWCHRSDQSQLLHDGCLRAPVNAPRSRCQGHPDRQGIRPANQQRLSCW